MNGKPIILGANGMAAYPPQYSPQRHRGPPSPGYHRDETEEREGRHSPPPGYADYPPAPQAETEAAG